jgi:uncharacterized membrane protein YkvA (DUF1232 family)
MGDDTMKKKKPIKAKVSKRRHATEKELKYFNKEKRRAKEYVTDKQKTAELLKAAIEKMQRYIKILKNIKNIWDDLMTLIQLVRAWVKGEYRQVPWDTIVLAIAAVIYFVDPFDVIPDFIPWFGYIDDSAVIAFVIKSIHGDLDRFLEWEQEHSKK